MSTQFQTFSNTTQLRRTLMSIMIVPHTRKHDAFIVLESMHKLECIVTGIIASFMNLESKWTNHVPNRTTDAKCGAIHHHRAPTQGWKNPSFREEIIGDDFGSLVSASIPCPGLRSKGTSLRKGLWKMHRVAHCCMWFNFTTACLNLK